MNNPILSKTYEAGATVNPHRIAKWGAGDGKVIQGAGFTVALIGIIDALAQVLTGGRVEVVRAGIREVEYGGTITRGDALTSDSVGRAVAAVLDPDNPPYIIGFAEESGVVGDIRPCFIAPCLAPVANFAADADILVQNVTLTTEEVLALNATPIQLIAAPGAGKAIVPVLIQAFLDYATTAYDGVAAGEDLAIKYTDASGAILATMETTGFLDQASDQMRVQEIVNTTITPVANAALVAHLLSGEIATGDSPVKFRIHYKVIDTAI